MKSRTPQQRLRMILAHDFSGSTSYESCDIPTRKRIDVLIRKINGVYDTRIALLESQVEQAVANDMRRMTGIWRHGLGPAGRKFDNFKHFLFNLNEWLTRNMGDNPAADKLK